MSDLYVKQMLLGPMENFVYFIGNSKTRECLVVDPAWDIAAIIAAAEKEDMTIKGALITHYHPDHCGGHLWGHSIDGVAQLIEKIPMPIYVNKFELDGVAQVTGISKSDFTVCEGGDKIAIGDVNVTTIHTPGHTPGSQCFLCDNALVSGDTLFISGCGRVDLPGGSAEQLYYSLTTTLAAIPGETILYPGHNYDSKKMMPMHDVLKHNPLMKAGSLSEWKKLMGGS